MEEVKKRDSYRGPGAAGRSPGAKRSWRKRTVNRVKENDTGSVKESRKRKGKKKKNGSEDQEIVPLNAWTQLLLELCGDPRIGGGRWAQAVRVSVVRTDTLRLLTTPELDDFLRRVGDATARLVNMENFRRRKLFFEGKGIDCSWMSAWARRKAEYFDIYKLLGSMNFHEACRLISDQWKSFLGLLRAAKEGKLEPWQKVRPPGYRKDKDGQRIPIVVVRYDNYRVDMERKMLRLGYWNVDVPFTGKPRWLTRPGAKQGRLIIVYDPVKKRWYARISVEVALERRLNGGLKAGIDWAGSA